MHAILLPSFVALLSATADHLLQETSASILAQARSEEDIFGPED
jgi:hypothetical protein